VLRREPYRVFFPLGIVLAGAGVLPWLLFARGALSVWPGVPHALTMAQGFFLAVAIGFLGTMLPRRTGTAPLAVRTLVLLALGVIVAAGALLTGEVVLGEAAYAATLVGLALVAARRFPPDRPASFVFLPLAFVLGAIGAALVAAGALAPGRTLVAQGVMLPLVLGMAPVLTPIILGTRAPAARAYPVAAALLGASFLVDVWLPTAALLVRAAVCTWVLVDAGALAPAVRTGVHRAAYRLALLLVPTGLLAAALVPARRIALLHVTYGGGFALLIVAVTMHVTLHHGGRAALADRWPAGAVVAVVATVAAVAVRACLETFGAHYVDALLAAAALWLVAVAAWGAFLAPHLRNPR
jgi:uncharacterized protein involved in response to NO